MINREALPTAPRAAVTPRRPSVSASGVLGRPLGADQAVLAGGELADWQERNATASLPHVVRELRRAGNLDNLRRLLGEHRGPYRGRYPFLDTDIWKAVEGVVHEMARGRADADARAYYEESVDLAERAQATDGYLVSWFQDPERSEQPWSDLSHGHELYTLGHLAQAAVAASRQLGDSRLLAVARRFADLAVERFGPEGDPVYCGHPEVEMALVELFRETGEESYLELARLFVDRRGAGRLQPVHFPASYFQDHAPLREMQGVTGHAVRMAYLAAGATDVALETGDGDLVTHLERLWDDLVTTKSYLTGGTGSRHTDEAIGDRYELPAERAYAETCAAVGVMQWGWRLFLATGRADVLDHVERVLFNGYAVGTSAEGTAYFYDNPLQRRPDHQQLSGAELDGEPLRRSWFGCPCCPPNALRWTAQLHEHVAVCEETSLTVTLLTGARLTSVGRGGPLDVEVVTDLPWHSRVEVRVLRAVEGPSTLRLRVPGWAVGASATLLPATGPAAGSSAEPTSGDSWSPVATGWWELERTWCSGDRVLLDLPLAVRAVTGHAHLDAVRGAAAVVCGPLVLCVEQVDAGAPLDDLVLDVAALSDAHEGPVGDPWHRLRTSMRVVPPAAPDLYPPWPEAAPTGQDHAGQQPGARAAVALVPYALWGNRGPGAMRVWLRTS